MNRFWGTSVHDTLAPSKRSNFSGLLPFCIDVLVRREENASSPRPGNFFVEADSFIGTSERNSISGAGRHPESYKLRAAFVSVFLSRFSFTKSIKFERRQPIGSANSRTP